MAWWVPNLVTRLKKINVWVWVLPVLFFLVSCQSAPGLPYYQNADWTPEWVNPKKQAVHQVESFHLTNQRGQTVSDRDLSGKIYLANFIFTTCPGVCPLAVSKMKTLQEAYLNDPEVLILSHSVQPEVDTVSRLQEFAKEHGIDSRTWYLLTGDKKQIYELARRSYFADEDLGENKGPDDFLHSEKIILVDGQKHLRGVYNSTDPMDLLRIPQDIETLKRESNHPFRDLISS